MELGKEELQIKLNSWTCLESIDWLCWSNRNGIYKDEDSLPETGVILDKTEAISIITRQILEG
jgi:hypothetical protein